MNHYEQKKQSRVERYQAKAAAKRRESEARANSDNIKTVQGMAGEPVKIGHHSEGRHRRLLERADKDMQKSYEASKSAEEYERRAAAAASNKTISSDDPEALQKLRTKLDLLEAKQTVMKRVNAAYRKFKKNPEYLDKCDLCDSEKKLVSTFKAESWQQDIPFPSYKLSNNNAVIKTTRKRIEQMVRRAGQQTKTEEHDGFSIIENVEANRVQIVFDDKPDDETRDWLKSHGFKWSPKSNAWQRYLNESGRSMAQAFVLLSQKEGAA